MGYAGTVSTQHVAAGSEHATVKANTPAGLIVHGTFGVATAHTALGCLVQPEVGDRVLISRSETECFVLMVLARDGVAARCIEVEGELRINADRLMLAGRDETRVSGHRRLHLTGNSVASISDSAEINARRVSVSGEQGYAGFNDARLVTRKMEMVADRIVQSAREVVRRVEEVETLSIGSLIQRVRKNWLVRSKRASVTASGDMHIDGERIHMG